MRLSAPSVGLRPRPSTGASSSASGLARRRLRAAAAVWLLALGLGFGGRLVAQAPDPTVAASAAAPIPLASGGTVELSRTVRRDLYQIQDQWLQWTTAFQTDQKERGERLVESLMAQVNQLGLRRLPDLSVGAALLAVEAAREEDFTRAEWALAAAERFDPGRPETSFARAEVERLAGHPGTATGTELEGYARIFSLPLGRGLGRANLVIWLFTSLLAAGAAFVVLQIGVKGAPLGRDLETLLGHRPHGEPGSGPMLWLRRLVVLALLLWPLALPSGFVWLALWWSALLMTYGSASERLVLLGLWAVLAAAPWIIDGERQKVQLMLAPPVRALANIEAQRLYGSLFSDIGQLRSRLPDEPAVWQLLADVYRDLGQWEGAKALYQQVLRAEPENDRALVALGGYYFMKRDFGKAREYYQEAADLRPDNVVAFYNLSQAYSESYLFRESRGALQEAQKIDDLAVSRLLQQTGDERIFTPDGGVDRADEIRRELARLDHYVSPGADGRRSLAALLAVLGGAVAVALGFHLLRNRLPATLPPPDRSGSAAGSRWRRTLVPGLASARDRFGGRAFFALLLPVSLVFLPALGKLGYPFGVRFGTQGSVVWFLIAVGLTAYFGFRVWLEMLRPA